MTVEIVQAEPRDRERWDAWVDAHPEASPYHLFAWKEAIEGVYGHGGRYLMAVDADRVVGILPLVRMAGPLGGRALVSLPFCDVGGPLAETPAVSEELRRAALALARQDRVGVVELRESVNDAGSVGPAAKVRMLLDLPGSAEALWATFPSKLRSQIKKAEKNGLSFRWGVAEDLGLFYRVFSRNMRDLGSPVHSRAWLHAVVCAFGPRCRIGLVLLGEEPVGCGLVLVAGSRACIPWASTVREANPLGPNMLLYWKLLEGAADEGLEAFDFGRSTPGEGTYRFKAQWGAKPQALRWQRALADGPWHDLRPGTSRVRDAAARVWSHLPLGVANAVGPALRRYISL